MQKRANRILSMLLALVMVLAMLPAAVFAEGEADVLTQWGITLGENIGVKFCFDSEHYTVTATVDGAEVTPDISGSVATVNVAAAQMTDTIGLTVKDGEEVVHTGEYSVRQYAETILTGEYDDYVKQIVKQLLNYGAAAQTYFGYNTENPANKDYEITNEQIPAVSNSVTVEGAVEGIRYYGASLVFQSRTAVRFYFTVSGDISAYTFKVGATPYEPALKDGLYYVEVGNINPQDLDKAVTVTVNDALSVSYSPLNYIVRMYAKGGTNLKNLLQAMYCYHLEAKYYSSVVPVGSLQSSVHPWSTGGIYATMPENDAYFVQDDWDVEYTPVNADVIKLVRGGVTTSVGVPGAGTLIKFTANNYYFKTEDHTISGEVLPLQDQDYLIVEGRFYHPGSGCTMYVSKTYIYNNGGTMEFSTTEPVLPVSYDVGVLQAHGNGGDSAGIYFTTQEVNDAPWGEWGKYYYDAASIDCVKLVRGNETVSVGLTDRNTILKFGTNDYYLRLENWTIGDYAPYTTDDMFIVEGAFTHKASKTTLNIEKTYIYHNGAAWVFSATEPEVIEPIVAYEVGVLSAHPGGVAKDVKGNIKGMHLTGAATDATYDADWSVEYTPVSAENYKLIRDGVTYNVGVTGSGTLAMFGQTAFYLKQEGHTFDSTKLPLQKGDILVVEGEWSCNQDADSIINITPTYILITGEGAVKIMDSQPNIVKINVLKESQNGRGDKGFYATADANAAPYNDWALRYVAQSADAVKFVTGGTTTDVADTNGEMLVKFSDYDYHFESWTLGGTFENIAEGDMYIVNGLFYNAANDVYLDIDTTYIKFTDDDELFGKTEPVVKPVYKMGVLTSHSGGVRVEDGSINGIYATGVAGTGATFNTDWSVEYAPVKAENYQLIRDGKTYNVGVPGTRTLIMFGDGQFFLEILSNIFNGELPLRNNDILVLEGKWSCNQDADSVINITKTYILIGDGTATFSATEPVIETIHSAGVLSAHSAPSTNTGIYAAGIENDAPYHNGWVAEYVPSSADCIKIVRNGKTYSTANTGAGTLVKIDASTYYVKFEGWMNGTYYPLQAGDIVIIEGIFVGKIGWLDEETPYTDAEGVKIKINKTYVVYNGSTFTFSTEDPRILNVGAMYTQGGSNWNSDLINFAVNANTAPYNDDWSVEYVPASNANIKLIRDGQTVNIANTGAGTVIKTSQSNCLLKLEQWVIGDVYPIREGDVLVVEGEFKNASNGYSMVIDKTYIVIGSKANDEVTFTAQYAETDFGAVVLPTSNKSMTIGVWNGSHHVFADKQLQDLKDAGITKIMGINTQWIGTEDVNAWLDRVYSYGISVIMDLRDWNGTDVPDYANHPGLMGFLMYDEPSADVFDDLAALKAKFDAVMPAGKLFYVNLFPECAADSSLGTESSWWDSLFGNDKDYDTDYVTAFLNALDIEVLSWDNYSLLNGKGIRTEYFHNFEVMASKNKTLWYTMLSAGHPTTAGNTYATPTADELRWQMAVAMTYGVRNIDHYTYTSHDDGYSCMVEYEDADGDGIYFETTALYNDIKAVDNEYLAWDNIFMAYDWQGVGVYDAGSTNTMLSVLENKLNLSNYGVTVKNSSEDLLVGVFDHNGSKAYMVTNAGSAGNKTVGDGKNFTTNDATVTLTLGAGSYKCVAVIDNGEISYVAVNADNTVSINVEAYEGVFVIPVLN